MVLVLQAWEDARLRIPSLVPQSESKQVAESDSLQGGTKRPLCEAMKVKLAERPGTWDVHSRKLHS